MAACIASRSPSQLIPQLMIPHSLGETLMGIPSLTLLHVAMLKLFTGSITSLRFHQVKLGSHLLKELSHLIRAYADFSALKSVALKATSITPSEITSYFQDKRSHHPIRTLKSWADGDIDQLLQEGRTIQKQLSSSFPVNPCKMQWLKGLLHLRWEGK